MKQIMIIILLSTLALAGCNTVHGFGKDLEKVGEKIGNAGK